VLEFKQLLEAVDAAVFGIAGGSLTHLTSPRRRCHRRRRANQDQEGNDVCMSHKNSDVRGGGVGR
jgi:hypothetical protein